MSYVMVKYVSGQTTVFENVDADSDEFIEGLKDEKKELVTADAVRFLVLQAGKTLHFINMREITDLSVYEEMPASLSTTANR